MERHGGKTVLFGRFVSILRYTVAWIRRFVTDELVEVFWNAARGVAWATAVGLVAY